MARSHGSISWLDLATRNDKPGTGPGLVSLLAQDQAAIAGAGITRMGDFLNFSPACHTS